MEEDEWEEGMVEGELEEELCLGETEEECYVPPPMPEGKKSYLRGNAKLPDRPYPFRHTEVMYGGT